MAVVGLLPYLGGVVGAGWLADRWGRRPVALLAPLLLGLALPLFMLDTGRQAGLMVQTLLMGGFACADVAIWTVLADVAPVGRVLPVLGNGLGTMVLAIGGGAGDDAGAGSLEPVGPVGKWGAGGCPALCRQWGGRFSARDAGTVAGAGPGVGGRTGRASGHLWPNPAGAGDRAVSSGGPGVRRDLRPALPQPEHPQDPCA